MEVVFGHGGTLGRGRSQSSGWQFGTAFLGFGFATQATLWRIVRAVAVSVAIVVAADGFHCYILVLQVWRSWYTSIGR